MILFVENQRENFHPRFFFLMKTASVRHDGINLLRHLVNVGKPAPVASVHEGI